MVRLESQDLRPFKGAMKLGLGCGSMMGAKGKGESLRALHCAYESGIRHFDVARSYGYGAAEHLLGEFIKTRRDQVSVTTKFGLRPSSQPTVFLDLAKKIARSAFRIVPQARRLIKIAGAPLSSTTHFDAQELLRDFERSLQELGTDYVDVLLLHGGNTQNVSDAVIELGQRLVSKGAARYFGVATDWLSGMALREKYSETIHVLQSSFSAFDRIDGPARISDSLHYCGHSPFGRTEGRKLAEFAVATNKKRDWTTKLQIEDSLPRAVPELLLRWAISQPALDLIIFSSFSPGHIQSNVRIAALGPLNTKAATALRQLVDEFTAEANPR